MNTKSLNFRLSKLVSFITLQLLIEASVCYNQIFVPNDNDICVAHTGSVFICGFIVFFIPCAIDISCIRYKAVLMHLRANASERFVHLVWLLVLKKFQ